MRIRPSLAVLLAAVLTVGACGAERSPSPSPSAAGPGSPAATPAATGPIPLLVDTDMSVDDVLALMVVLRDPGLDVRAIAVDGTGLTHCSEGTRNVRRLLAAFGEREIRIGCGRERPGPNGREFPPEWRAGADSLFGIDLPTAPASSLAEDAPALISDVIAGSPTPLTILALGPWTNLADALAADPSLAGRIAGIHAMAGAIDVPGNIELGGTTPADGVEWNVGADPDAFADVLAFDIPVALVPLDATNDIPVPADIADRLEPDHAAAGADIAYEIYVRNPYLAGGENYLWDPLAALTLTAPDLVTWEDASLTMTATGSQAGRLVRGEGGRPVRFATTADGTRAYEALFAALRRGAPRPQPFELTGTLRVRWSGAACRIEGTPPATAGLAGLELVNDSDEIVFLLVAGVKAPRTWADLLAVLETVDLGDPELVIPDWILQVDGGAQAEAGTTSSGIVTLPAAEVGVVCATGEFPELDFVDGGSFGVSG